jgi:CheY-like chemotaxis protein
VIVLSREAPELAELRAFREGCGDYLRKPVSYPVLRAVAGASAPVEGRPRCPPADRRALRSMRFTAWSGSPTGRSRCPAWSRAALAPRGRADPRVHEAGAAAGGLGLLGDRQHPHGRRPRLPATQEACTRGSAPPGRQRVGCWLPAVGGSRRRGRRRLGHAAVSRRPCGVAARFREAADQESGPSGDGLHCSE